MSETVFTSFFSKQISISNNSLKAESKSNNLSSSSSLQLNQLMNSCLCYTTNSYFNYLPYLTLYLSFTFLLISRLRVCRQPSQFYYIINMLPYYRCFKLYVTKCYCIGFMCCCVVLCLVIICLRCLWYVSFVSVIVIVIVFIFWFNGELYYRVGYIHILS